MNAVNQNRELTRDEICDTLSVEEKLDYAVPAHLVSSEITPNGGMLFRFPETKDGDIITLKMTDYCADQFHGKLCEKGFTGYAQFMREQEMRDTYFRNIVDLTERLPVNKVFRIRTIKGGSYDEQTVRAVLSDKFKPIDDDIVFDTALPLIEASGRFTNIGGNKTDTRTVMKFVEKEPSLRIQSGGRMREFYFGFKLKNSEVGASKTEYNFFICDGWCSNGCTFGRQDMAIISYRHVGARIDTRHGLICQTQVEEAELASITKLIHDATMQAMTMKGREKITTILTDASERSVTIDHQEFFKNLHKATKLTKKEIDQLPLYLHSDEMTQLGIQAGITAMAQHVAYERRLELEEIGGDVLSLSAKQWTAMAVA